MAHSILQSCLIMITFLFPICKPVDERLKVNDKFSISIPYKYEENMQVLEIIQKTNSDVIALYQFEHSDLPKTLMSITSYSSSQPMSLDSAFYNEKVGAVSNNIGTMLEDYKLISYEAYDKNEMKLYRKVSSPIDGKCAVMYYFYVR